MTDFLIYVDILGYDKLARDLATSKSMSVDMIRTGFQKTLVKIIDKLTSINKIIKSKNLSTDAYILISKDDYVIDILFELINNRPGYHDLEHLPLEIGVGITKNDIASSDYSIDTSQTYIDFVKSNLFAHFRKQYKEKNKKSIESTFVILTSECRENLDFPFVLKYMQKKIAKYNSTKKTYYELDIEYINNNGLLSKFLEIVGLQRSKIYNKLQEVTVKPHNYEELQRLLSNNRLLIISGQSETGKSYIAMNLLWDYFRNQITPNIYLGETEKSRKEYRKDFENYINFNHDKVIVYDDLFGKIEYEENNIARKIGGIIDEINQFDNLFIIITCRTSIYSEFLVKLTASIDIDMYHWNMDQYFIPEHEFKSQLLNSWSEFYDTVWKDNPTISDFITDQILKSRFLPSALSIQDFCRASKFVTDQKELLKILKDKSLETSRSFALEIKTYETSSQVFLIILYFLMFISEKNQYHRYYYYLICNELKITPSDYNHIIDKFLGVSIDYDNFGLNFSHDSYRTAIPLLFFEINQYPTQITNEILPTIFNILLTIEYFRDQYRNTEYYEKYNLEHNNTKLNSFVISSIYSTFLEKYSLWPYSIRGIISDKLDNPEQRKLFARELYTYYGDIPKTIRQKWLDLLLEREETYGEVLSIIIWNYDIIEERYKNQVDMLLKNDEAIYAIGEMYAMYYDNLDDIFIEKVKDLLAETETAGTLVECITQLNIRNDPRINKVINKFIENDQYLDIILEGSLMGHNYKNLSPSQLLYLLENAELTSKFEVILGFSHNKLNDDQFELLINRFSPKKILFLFNHSLVYYKTSKNKLADRIFKINKSMIMENMVEQMYTLKETNPKHFEKLLNKLRNNPQDKGSI